MPVRPIVRLGHPALRSPALPVDIERLPEDELQTLIDDMFETMLDAGGVGLAAPQLGLSLQLFVYAVVDPDREPEAEDEDPELVALINPALEPIAGELVYDWEGCLSIPDLRGLVPRHHGVRIHALDRDGKALDYRVEGYVARIVQHEYDHLNGVVFLDRMRDMRSLAFKDEWEQLLTTSTEDEAAEDEADEDESREDGSREAGSREASSREAGSREDRAQVG
ncbi:MAG: peptide deformylase [Acidobacteriota bacterium]